MKRLLVTLMLCAWAVTASAQTLAGGSLTTNGQALTAGISHGGAPVVGVSVQVTGTWTGTLTFQGSVDGSNFVSILATNLTSGASVTTTTASGAFSITNAGFRSIRVSATAAMTGTAVVVINQGYAGGGGGGASGSVTQGTSPWVVAPETGSFAEDATHDEAAKTGGPQVMGECDDTATDAVDEGDAGRMRINCASRALLTETVDPCSALAKTTDPISITADTVIIAATSGKKNYICSLVIVAGAAEIASITEGTGSTCGTSEAALAGSTTDANGLSFAANGGVSAIGGNATIIAGKTANVDTCLNVSGSNRVSGWVTWVQR